MFTGIIQCTGTVAAIEKANGCSVRITTKINLDATPLGASIACNGVCLTVAEKGDDWFRVDVSRETLCKSTIDGWKKGTKINLEPSLKLGDELGGHFVFGHVDGVVTLQVIEKQENSYRVTFEAPAELTGFLAPKGSVTLDGISLTVNMVRGSIFSVMIVPHTWAQTTLSEKQPGDVLNIEVDMLARYVSRLLEQQRNAA